MVVKIEPVFKKCPYYWEKSRVDTYYDVVSIQEADEAITNTAGNLHAVLINGNPDEFSLNTRLVFDRLIEMGVPKRNILSLEGINDRRDKESYFPATQEGLEKAVKDLEGKCTEKDRLFVYTTNHGYRGWDGTCGLHLADEEEITSSQFYDYVKGIKCNFGLFLFSQCFSGGFAEEIARHKRFIGISSSNANRISWSKKSFVKETSKEGYFKTVSRFTKLFMPLITKKGNSIKEAFIEAAKKDWEIVDEQIREFPNVYNALNFNTPQLFYWNANPCALCLNSYLPEDAQAQEEAR